MAAIKVEIRGDEWWLKSEQHPSETREEWKAHTFGMHYGRRNRSLISAYLSLQNPMDEEEANRMYKRFMRKFPWVSGLIEKGDDNVDSGS